MQVADTVGLRPSAAYKSRLLQKWEECGCIGLPGGTLSVSHRKVCAGRDASAVIAQPLGATFKCVALDLKPGVPSGDPGHCPRARLTLNCMLTFKMRE